MTGERGTVLVTGANRGIGAGIALELAARGYRIACLTRSATLPEAPPELAPALFAVRCDVTDPDSLRLAMEAAAAEGRIVGLVNNAGMHMWGPSHEFPLADWEAMLRTNLTSVFLACQAAYPHLKAAGRATVVNIGSYWERVGAKHNVAYAATKAGVGAITRCLAVEWALEGITVLNVAPGYVRTDMNAGALDNPRFRDWLVSRIPVGRVGTVGEVSRLVAALFVEDLHYLTGETIFMDGGQTINQ